MRCDEAATTGKQDLHGYCFGLRIERVLDQHQHSWFGATEIQAAVWR